ncbi:unnamed protein product [Owenia fusiformis]|uniref:G-protein coupled receptors family 1 profile domain-containing protein n=1 Tax=Owenia fusiformis TaxID=6347 RepID=A0A8S4PUA1_OWEFU|nr:unnamed protein product [Owenia fusiformis]
MGTGKTMGQHLSTAISLLEATSQQQDDSMINATKVNLNVTASNENKIEEIDWRDMPDTQTAKLVWKIGSPTIICIGLIGNILTITVLCATRMRKTTSSLYLTILAISDCMVLICGLGRRWVSYQWGKDIRNQHELACKIHMFLTYTFIDFSAWLLAAVTVDRVITVYMPLHARRISTKKNAAIAIIVTFVVLMGINAQILFTHGNRTIPWNGGFYTYPCTYNDGNVFFHNIVWKWIDGAVSSYLPFFILIISNIVIAIQLLRSAEMRKKTMNVSKQSGDSTASLSIMLITISMVFLVLTGPVVVYLITWDQWHEDKSHANISKLRLVWACLNMLLYSNYCVNFFMYCLSGKRFRSEMMILFRCTSRKRNGHLRNSTMATGSTMASVNNVSMTTASEASLNNKL